MILASKMFLSFDQIWGFVKEFRIKDTAYIVIKHSTLEYKGGYVYTWGQEVMTSENLWI